MVKITIRGLEDVIKYIQSLPRGVRIAAMRAFTTYLVGNEQRGLKHEAPQQVASRAKAYGKVSDAPPGYFSWAQFRFVAWKTKGFTEIPWTRKHEIAPAWTIQEKNSDWRRVNIINPIPESEWVYGDRQARQLGLVGWRKWRKIVEDNFDGAMRAAKIAVNKVIKRKGKKE